VGGGGKGVEQKKIVDIFAEKKTLNRLLARKKTIIHRAEKRPPNPIKKKRRTRVSRERPSAEGKQGCDAKMICQGRGKEKRGQKGLKKRWSMIKGAPRPRKKEENGEGWREKRNCGLNIVKTEKGTKIKKAY